MTCLPRAPICQPGRCGARAKRVGAYAQLLAKAYKNVTLMLPASEQRIVLGAFMAIVEAVSNRKLMNAAYREAVKNKWLGKRSREPCRLPRGGEGKASGGLLRSRKGIYAKGKRTRNNKIESQGF